MDPQNGQQNAQNKEEQVEQVSTSQQTQQAPIENGEQKKEEEVLVSTQRLQELFNKYDGDKDGKLNCQQIVKILQDQLGESVYEGTIQWTLKLINYNVVGVQYDSHTINFEQFRQYYEVHKSSLRLEMWEQKYKILKQAQDIKDQYLINQKQEVAPTQKIPVVEWIDPSLKGDIQITIGPQDYKHNSYLKANMQKQPKRCQEAIARVTLYQESPQKSIEFCERLIQLQKQLKQLLITRDPDLEYVIKQLVFKATADGNKIHLELKITNKEVNQIIQSGLQFIQEVLGQKVDFKLSVDAKFDWFAEKFMNPQDSYSFHHGFTKNFYIRAIWNAFNFKEATRAFAKSAMSHFQTKIHDPLYPLIVLLLHAKNCNTKISFDNSDLFEFQIERSIKKHVLRHIQKFYNFMMRYKRGQSAIEALKLFENEFDFEVEAGDWRVYGKAKVKDCNLMLSEEYVSMISKKND